MEQYPKYSYICGCLICPYKLLLSVFSERKPSNLGLCKLHVLLTQKCSHAHLRHRSRSRFRRSLSMHFNHTLCRTTSCAIPNSAVFLDTCQEWRQLHSWKWKERLLKVLEKLLLWIKGFSCQVLVWFYYSYSGMVFFCGFPPSFSDLFWQYILIYVPYSIKVVRAFTSTHTHLTDSGVWVFFEKTLNRHSISKPLRGWRKAQ